MAAPPLDLFAGFLLIRGKALGFSAVMPLLGAATVAPHLAGARVLGLVGVAVAFHIFAYVLNDVVDLPLDRSDPERIAYPLVRGTIRPAPALALALLQAPLAAGLTAWLGGDSRAYAALASAFAALAAYDLWGKRAPFPPLTDAVQGLGWAGLVLYGALLAPGPLTRLTAVIVATMVVFIILINGVHGGLRDVANDRRCGMRTTAILLSARPAGDGARILVPRGLLVYGLVLQLALSSLLLLPLAANWPGYAPAAWRGTLAAELLCAGASLALLAWAAGRAGTHAMLQAGGIHILVSMAALIALPAAGLDGRLLAVLVLTYLAPVLTWKPLYRPVQRIWARRA